MLRTHHDNNMCSLVAITELGTKPFLKVDIDLKTHGLH
jgi:hypothetical protein